MDNIDRLRAAGTELDRLGRAGLRAPAASVSRAATDLPGHAAPPPPRRPGRWVLVPLVATLLAVAGLAGFGVTRLWDRSGTPGPGVTAGDTGDLILSLEQFTGLAEAELPATGRFRVTSGVTAEPALTGPGEAVLEDCSAIKPLAGFAFEAVEDTFAATAFLVGSAAEAAELATRYAACHQPVVEPTSSVTVTAAPGDEMLVWEYPNLLSSCVPNQPVYAAAYRNVVIVSAADFGCYHVDGRDLLADGVVPAIDAAVGAATPSPVATPVNSCAVGPGETVTGLDLSGHARLGFECVGVSVTDSTFVGADLRESTFADLHVGRVSFADADLSASSFTDSVVFETSFAGATADSASFTGSVFTSVDWQGAWLRGADFHGTNFTDCDLTGADLSGANLQGANLSGADLADVVLTGATYNADTAWPDGFSPPDDAIWVD
jgi:hypothetical protein